MLLVWSPRRVYTLSRQRVALSNQPVSCERTQHEGLGAQRVWVLGRISSASFRSFFVAEVPNLHSSGTVP